MRIEILDDLGQVINVIEADIVFAETKYPGKWREAEIPVAQPVISRRLSTLAFRDRFTMDEKRAIYTAAQTVVDVRIWLDDLNAATPDSDGTAVDLDDLRTVAGVQALEAAGLIGTGRAAEILS